MQNIASNLFKILICLVFLSTGFVLGKYHSFPIYYFKKDIDLVGVATIITNIFLAWYISRIIGKRNDIDKKDKEIVLNRLDRIISNWELFITQVRSNNLHYIDVTSFIKRSSKSIERTCNTFSTFHPFEHSEISNEISNETKKLLTLMTYTSPYVSASQNTQEPVTIVQDIISYTPARTDEILLKIELIIDEIIKLQLLINAK